MAALPIAVCGALGRMGRRVIELASSSKDFKVTAAFDRPGAGEPAAGMPVSKISPAALAGVRVAIDFSSPRATAELTRAAAGAGTALVVGTTGLGKKETALLKRVSSRVPVLVSPNMSIGANFLFELARLAAETLRDGYDIEIVEAHHRLKKDAPSGTAKRLAEVIAKAKGWDLARASRYGRQGFTGERSKNELGIHVIRAGDIVGEHRVLFGGAGETVELKHLALSRDTFARGALQAARFLATKKKGFYTMADVLKG